MITIIKLISMFTWELPQTIVGFLMFCYFILSGKARKVYLEDTKVIVNMTFTSWNHSSDSMGHFVFFNVDNYDLYIQRHEFGHSVQSYIVGWLYLPVITLPSLYGWVLCKIGVRQWKDYYTHFPENWANKLGGNKTNR